MVKARNNKKGSYNSRVGETTKSPHIILLEPIIPGNQILAKFTAKVF